MGNFIGKKLILPIVITEDTAALDSSPCFLTEGLIETYPIEQSVKALSRVCNLKLVPVYDFSAALDDYNKLTELYNGIISIVTSSNETEVIEVVMDDCDYNFSIVERYLKKYGYFFSAKKVLNNNVSQFQFEKKFDYDATQLVQNEKYLYHICDSNVVDKILKKGLTPHTSQWNFFKNDYRCYFFLNVDKEKLNHWIQDFKRNKNVKSNNKEYSILRIDVSKLPDTMKFYVDPRMQDGVYSLEGVPPSAIEIIR